MRQERKTVTMKRKRPPAVNEGLLNYVPPRTPWVTQLATSAYAISGSPFQRALLETADVRLETKAGQSIEPCISTKDACGVPDMRQTFGHQGSYRATAHPAR